VINVHGNLASVLSLADVLKLGETPEEGLLLILAQEYGGFAILVEGTKVYDGNGNEIYFISLKKSIIILGKVDFCFCLLFIK